MERYIIKETIMYTYKTGMALVKLTDDLYVFEKEFPIVFESEYIENNPDIFEKSDEKPNIELAGQKTQLYTFRK